MVEVFDDATQRLRDGFDHEGATVGDARQRPEVRVLDRFQPQSAGEGVDGAGRRADVAALFEADVSIDADAGEFSHFLAPQAQGATLSSTAQTHRLRAQPFPS